MLIVQSYQLLVFGYELHLHVIVLLFKISIALLLACQHRCDGCYFFFLSLSRLPLFPLFLKDFYRYLFLTQQILQVLLFSDEEILPLSICFGLLLQPSIFPPQRFAFVHQSALLIAHLPMLLRGGIFALIFPHQITGLAVQAQLLHIEKFSPGLFGDLALGVPEVIVVLYLAHSFVLGGKLLGVLLGEGGKEGAPGKLAGLIVDPINGHAQLSLPQKQVVL